MYAKVTQGNQFKTEMLTWPQVQAQYLEIVEFAIPRDLIKFEYDIIVCSHRPV